MKATLLAFSALLALTTPALSIAAPAPKMDLLSQMFTWWNAAYAVPGAYTPDAFRKYFTEDAVLMIDGRVSARGVNDWAQHFQHIQQSGGSIKIVLPFHEEFQSGDKIYTNHIIRSVHHGVLQCELVAGHAVVRGGKLALVDFVRTDVDPAKGPTEPACTPLAAGQTQ